MSKKFFTLVACLLACLPAQAQQEGFAFLRVSHYCPMPYMLPDYFQQEAWGDSVARVSADWLKTKLKVRKVDVKQHEALTYHPTRLPVEARGVNFSETAYAYFAELQTELTLGNKKKNLPELDKGIFSLYLRVFDQKQRKVLQESLKIHFTIQPDGAGKGDVWLNNAQFKTLYNKALRALMQKESIEKKPLNFMQMPSEEVSLFLAKANKTLLTTEGRGKFTWVRPDTAVSLLLELQTPHYEDKTYRREATFVRAGKERIQLKGLLPERTPQEVFIQFAAPQMNLAGVQNSEVLDLAETETKRNAWTWLAYQHNGLVKVYEGDELKAVFIKNEGYEVYLSPTCRNRDLQMIGKLLVAEVLVRALQKQYEVR
ncbi:MAG: hypothetical protein EAZ95_17780 [Bacteroidetes bacterium]|nr:MAG: hypothetical protein EAZ95_17780 [Bacteroidota bacterium]